MSAFKEGDTVEVVAPTSNFDGAFGTVKGVNRSEFFNVDVALAGNGLVCFSEDELVLIERQMSDAELQNLKSVVLDLTFWIEDNEELRGEQIDTLSRAVGELVEHVATLSEIVLFLLNRELAT